MRSISRFVRLAVVLALVVVAVSMLGGCGKSDDEARIEAGEVFFEAFYNGKVESAQKSATGDLLKIMKEYPDLFSSIETSVEFGEPKWDDDALKVTAKQKGYDDVSLKFVDSDGDVKVTVDGEEGSMVLKMKKADGAWKVYDALINGSSLVENYEMNPPTSEDDTATTGSDSESETAE